MNNIDFQNGFVLGLVAVGKAGSAINIPTVSSSCLYKEVLFVDFEDEIFSDDFDKLVFIPLITTLTIVDNTFF